MRFMSFRRDQSPKKTTEMAIFSGGDVYAKLGVRHVINAVGNQTNLDGSSPSDVVRDSMEDANGNYVEMRELLVLRQHRKRRLAFDNISGQPYSLCHSRMNYLRRRRVPCGSF